MFVLVTFFLERSWVARESVCKRELYQLSPGASLGATSVTPKRDLGQVLSIPSITRGELFLNIKGKRR